MFDVKAMAGEVVKSVREYVDGYVKSIFGRMELLEASIKALPVPKDGEPGRDGKDAEIDWARVDEQIKNAESRSHGRIDALKETMSLLCAELTGLEDLRAQVKELTERPAPKDGKDAAEVDVSALELSIYSKLHTSFAAGYAADFAKLADELRTKAQPGHDGTNGIDGRDALHLEILAEIDTEKSYPRNTYAKHAGGLWRSFEKTADMRGWECLVNGVSAVEYEHSEDSRVVSVKTLLSDGTASSTVMQVPTMIYRGVFTEGKQYREGDTVTWGGSLWHCDADTDDKPGTPGVKSWTLAVKKGAPGRDGQAVIDTTKAVRL